MRLVTAMLNNLICLIIGWLVLTIVYGKVEKYLTRVVLKLFSFHVFIISW